MVAGRSEYTKTDGSVGEVNEVHFSLDQGDSSYVGEGDAGDTLIKAEAIFLPMSRGYGVIKNLTISMSENEVA